jgi:predicted RNA-binding protein with EMAP domain
MGGFVTSNSLTQDKVIDNLTKFVNVTKDKLDYLGAFLDIAVKYYSHTGTQTLARRLIERAVAEL